MLTLIGSFFLVALLYATVGFGGGSSYIALLAAGGVPFDMIPKISLICNILVVTGGTWNFYRSGYFDKKLVFPFVLTSMPMAFLGGLFPITENAFYVLLTLTLAFCGLRILFLPDKTPHEIRLPSLSVSLTTGAIFGFLSGITGIGGGIFLSPLLIHLGWARAKEAASVASTFILLNSLAGLAGQFSKGLTFSHPETYLPLFIAVIFGGQIGSRIGAHPGISYHLIQKGTGILTLIICGRLLIKIF